MVKASLADIKEGTFIGVRPCRSRTAARRPIGHSHLHGLRRRASSPTGFRHWDSRPGSTMTNANVATTVSGKDGQDLLVKYKDGEKKVIVPPGTPIAQVWLPGSAADLKVGRARSSSAAQKQPDGSLIAPNITVGRDDRSAADVADRSRRQ